MLIVGLAIYSIHRNSAKQNTQIFAANKHREKKKTFIKYIHFILIEPRTDDHFFSGAMTRKVTFYVSENKLNTTEWNKKQ